MTMVLAIHSTVFLFHLLFTNEKVFSTIKTMASGSMSTAERNWQDPHAAHLVEEFETRRDAVALKECHPKEAVLRAQELCEQGRQLFYSLLGCATRDELHQVSGILDQTADMVLRSANRAGGYEQQAMRIYADHLALRATLYS